ncbi:FAD-dependent monooxygenase [Pelagicoccus sp. SDUM812003]|uniref:NAD(P)/FAD-dependent oxidoreductase n=1 Tax=Pelagicoccus sp. SDUM812003 TaxID=3041267 RepID=UPI00280F3489|nr:FAD-dependent monooxygenase [Pelagicoccus sp. SDUM812003]MDQ8204360.1 FAD-dependent monooxygenase [Pelagicoccus sp. SDUM812003]
MISQIREIRIVGGGLAGLALGIGLRREGVPTTVVEAGDYPRHKVCGEFVSGLSRETIDSLGITEVFEDALPLRETLWRQREEAFRTDRLPQPAWGISRYRLDQRLADRFRQLGGELLTKTRDSSAEAKEGVVRACGRSRRKSEWIGLKAHVYDLALSSDLEMRLGRQAYVGASEVEDGKVNVCGLFRKRLLERSSRSSILIDYLAASGLEAFADRLSGVAFDHDSLCSVAGLEFGRSPYLSVRELRVGDAFAMPPPFTGDGMAMAFQGALLAREPLVSYARGMQSWKSTCRHVSSRLRSQFRARLGAAWALHPFLFRAGGQSLFRCVSQLNLLPFRPLFQLLHA